MIKVLEITALIPANHVAVYTGAADEEPIEIDVTCWVAAKVAAKVAGDTGEPYCGVFAACLAGDGDGTAGNLDLCCQSENLVGFYQKGDKEGRAVAIQDAKMLASKETR